MKFLLKNSLNIAIMYITAVFTFYLKVDLLTTICCVAPLCLILGIAEDYFSNKEKYNK